jgi:hypothetical protein
LLYCATTHSRCMAKATLKALIAVAILVAFSVCVPNIKSYCGASASWP